MRMLIADDDRALGSFLARGLEQDGHEVTVATDGEMAMEAARNDLPEMAVLDLNLPRRDGTEVLEFLRSLTEDVPILILTARQEPETRLRCLEMGADDFMQKPFSFAELRARCRALMRRRSPGLVLRQGDLEVNRVERTVTRAGRPVTLVERMDAVQPATAASQPAATPAVAHAIVSDAGSVARTAGAVLERMDAAAAPQMVESAPHRLAVGVRSDGLGWVEIHTHAAAGEVSAVVAASAGEAQAAVHASLPEMREYLAGQHVYVDQLASEAYPSSSDEGRGAAGGEGGGSASRPETQSLVASPANVFGEEDEDEVLSYISVRV